MVELSAAATWMSICEVRRRKCIAWRKEGRRRTVVKAWHGECLRGRMTVERSGVIVCSVMGRFGWASSLSKGGTFVGREGGQALSLFNPAHIHVNKSALAAGRWRNMPRSTQDVSGNVNRGGEFSYL